MIVYLLVIYKKAIARYSVIVLSYSNVFPMSNIQNPKKYFLMKENFHLCITKIKSRSFPEQTLKKFLYLLEYFILLNFPVLFPFLRVFLV